MKELALSGIPDFLNRFQDFYDALVREVRVGYTTKHSRTRVKVTLSVQDLYEKANGGWVNLTFEMDNVTRFRLIEGKKTTCVVLSYGLIIKPFESKIYFDFSPYTPEPRGIEDFDKSDFLVVCEKCSWFVTPYREGV